MVDLSPGYEQVTETFNIGGRSYTLVGARVVDAGDQSFKREVFQIKQYNGFVVTLIGTSGAQGLSFEAYQPYKEVLLQILSTLYWFENKSLAVPTLTCAGMWTRLHPDMYARVVDDAKHTPNRVRSEPFVGDNIITELNPFSVVKVMEGPVCSNGLVFWLVESERIPGGSGWTAEGDLSTYWLEPYNP